LGFGRVVDSGGVTTRQSGSSPENIKRWMPGCAGDCQKSTASGALPSRGRLHTLVCRGTESPEPIAAAASTGRPLPSSTSSPQGVHWLPRGEALCALAFKNQTRFVRGVMIRLEQTQRLYSLFFFKMVKNRLALCDLFRL
jgi:hypothetical protein